LDNPPDKQLNIFISPEVTAKLREAAEFETEKARRAGVSRSRVTKSGLAFEIFSWAFQIYKEVGSLEKLKSLDFSKRDGWLHAELKREEELRPDATTRRSRKKAG
jgi:hypothetical protein